MMISSLLKILPMLLTMVISQLIYLVIDGKYNITRKISSRLSMKPEWQAAFCILCLLIIIFIIGVIGIYVINIPVMLYSIIIGTFTGVGVVVSNNLFKKRD